MFVKSSVYLALLPFVKVLIIESESSKPCDLKYRYDAVNKRDVTICFVVTTSIHVQKLSQWILQRTEHDWSEARVTRHYLNHRDVSDGTFDVCLSSLQPFIKKSVDRAQPIP